MKRALRFTAHALSKVGPCHCLPLHALKNTGLKNLRIKELNYQACYTSVIILSMCVCVLYKLACIPIRSWYSAFFPKYLIPYRIFQKLKPNSISKSGNLVSIRYGIPPPTLMQRVLQCMGCSLLIKCWPMFISRVVFFGSFGIELGQRFLSSYQGTQKICICSIKFRFEYSDINY